MNDTPPILDIVESEEFQEQIVGHMIDSFVLRLSRPGDDGKVYRSFILDWLYFERPMLARYKGAEFSVQLEGPAVVFEGKEYPLGGFIQRGLEWARIDPVAASDLRKRLDETIDRTVQNWMAHRELTFVPAHPEPPFEDRAAADAESLRQISASARYAPDLGDFEP